MKLMARLRNLNRGVLVALIVALLAMEGALIWASVQAVQPRRQVAVQAPTPVRGLPTRSGQTQGEATPEPLQTPVVQPVSRQAGPLVAQGDLAAVARLFDAEQAMSFVETLADPAWGGRLPGSPGSDAAAEYIADRFEDYGLQPAGTAGYFQPFTAPYAQITAVPTFVVTTTAGTVYDDFTFREDFAFWWGGYAGGGVAAGQVFWLNEGKHEDYRGLDVSGQIVFCKFSFQDIEETLRQAVEHEASGLILLTDQETRITMRRTYRQAAYLPQSLPTLVVLPEVGEALLAGSGYSLDDLSLLYAALPLQTTAHFEIEMDEPGETEVRNVLGVLPGADPELRDQVLIVGAHYDHLGTDPNGDIYIGANDDASGVAVLLETARSWQEAGFTPDCTVLFAAWDSEEQGLLGSIHYVQNPRYPLTATVGMIQLDMVGLSTDGVMTLDGYDTPVGRQLRASADLFEVPTRPVSFQGGSDHMPFQRANIPAALLIWDDGKVPYYHTPQDTPDTLQPERLRQAGAMTSHAVMAMCNVMPRLQNALAEQVEAIRTGDADRYAATLDPEDAALAEVGRDWLASRPAEAREAFTATVSALEVGGDIAYGDVSAATQKEGRRTVLATYRAQFVRRGADWYIAGPATEVVTASHIAARLLRTGDGDSEWVQLTNDAYTSLTSALGLAEPSPVTVTVYPSESALTWLAGPGEGETASPLPGLHITRTASPTTTATSLVLRELGLPPGQGDWLRVGLEEWAKTVGAPDAQRQQAMRFTPSLDSTVSATSVLTGTASKFTQPDVAAAWAMFKRLVETYGGEGLAQLCQEWGQTGSQEGAFAALGTTPQVFAADWEDAVLRPLVEAREDIGALLRQREQAVLAGDKAAFLATVNPNDAVFLAEEEHWFDDLAEHPVDAYTLNAQVLTLEEDGVLARLEMTTNLADTSRGVRAQHDARFLRLDSGWVLAGPDWKTEEGEHFIIRYTHATTETVSVVLATAEQAYTQVVADLQHAPEGRTEIKLYEDDDAMRASILLSLPDWVLGWYEPGEAIKLSPRVLPVEVEARQWDPEQKQWIDMEPFLTESARQLTSVIAQEFTHLVLFDLGVRLGWFHEGVAIFESLRAAPEWAATLKMRYVPEVREAQRLQQLFDWADMPEYDEIGESQVDLFYGQSWMLVDEFVRQFGMDALNRLIGSLGAGRGFQQAFVTAAGMPFSEWEPQWDETVRLGGVPADFIRWSQGFSAQRATGTVEHLSSPAYAGRRTGSPQAEAAARSIAEQMESYNLEPGAPDGTFFQAVPVPYTELTAVPAASLESPSTGQTLSLTYQETFREVLGSHAGGGEVDASVVWLPGGYQEGMLLGGRIALKYQQEESVAEEARLAYQHGAGGLILVAPDPYTNMQERRLFAAEPAADAIPVVEIVESTWREIIKLSGLTIQEANNAPPALMLDLRARLTVPYEPLRMSTALSVIGVIPGTEPDAQPLLIAAYYDGVGDLPDGTAYPGANKNASGVAVLLDVARVLKESGFRPSNPIYFIAWGAEEALHASARYYADQPAVPLDQTLGLLELDTVGAAASYYLDLEGDKDFEGELLFNLRLAADLLERRVSPASYKGGNTHAVFHTRGVPSLLLSWPKAYDTHTPLDTPDTMDTNKLATTGEVVALAAMMLTQ